jgi:protein TonB
MFETVAPAAFTKKSNATFYEALPVSLALHAVVAMAFVLASVWTVAFPDQSPAQNMIFSIAEIPPPPPPPPPPPKAVEPEPEPELKPIQRMPDIVAPAFIPQEIPKIEPKSIIASSDSAAEGVEGGIPGGEAGGVIGGVIGGEIGGLISGTPGGINLEGLIKIARDKPLPLYPLSQVYPTYPDRARLNAWEDQLVVRYVIGKDGRVKEVTVLTPPEREIFTDSTVRAIRAWRFRPMIKDGQRQEVVHELTVMYRLVQS